MLGQSGFAQDSDQYTGPDTGDAFSSDAAETEAWRPYVRFQHRKHFSKFYGQLNMGILTYNDGETNINFGVVDNANSGSRVGFRDSQELDNGWAIRELIELSWSASSTATANITNREEEIDREIYGLRHADISFQHDKYGTFWIGQGAMASDGASSVDLSATNVIANSSVADTAGGQLLRTTSGQLFPVTIWNVFEIDNGLRRKVRFRYDSPNRRGYNFRASIGKDLLNNDDTMVYDIAASFYGKFGPGEAFEYRTILSIGKPKNAKLLLNGSASLLHSPTGLSLTAAIASESRARSTAQYLYLKTGFQRDFFKFGRTAFSADIYLANNIDGGLSSSTSYGIAFVQNFKKTRSQVYGTIRKYEYRRDAGGLSFSPGIAAFIGIRLRY